MSFQTVNGNVHLLTAVKHDRVVHTDTARTRLFSEQLLYVALLAEHVKH